MTRILITGGAGFIGSHLSDMLRSNEERIARIELLTTRCLKWVRVQSLETNDVEDLVSRCLVDIFREMEKARIIKFSRMEDKSWAELDLFRRKEALPVASPPKLKESRQISSDCSCNYPAFEKLVLHRLLSYRWITWKRLLLACFKGKNPLEIGDRPLAQRIICGNGCDWSLVAQGT